MTEPVRHLMLIDGELTPASNGDWLESINPATEEVIGRVPAAQAADINRAVVATSKAQRDWRELSIFQRGEYLRALADALRKPLPNWAQTWPLQPPIWTTSLA